MYWLAAGAVPCLLRGCTSLGQALAALLAGRALPTRPAQLGSSGPAAHTRAPAGVLQAMCFLECGKAYSPAKPWASGQQSCWVRAVEHLPPTARAMVERLTAADRPEA